MKTLSQVEPRIPITSVPFTISQAGSYYLVSNLTCSVAGSNGISITTSGVTLDLCGFSLIGPGGSSGYGIYAGGLNVHIRNGIVRNWYGYDKYGVYITGSASSLRDMEIRECASGAYLAGDAAYILDCQADTIGNTSLCYGIRTGHGAVVRNSMCQKVTGGGTAYGISVAEDCMVTGCQAWDVESSTTNGAGIRAFRGGRITDCVANYNEVHGLMISDRCLVANNTCIDNGNRGALVGGINILGVNNVIQNNHIARNYYGWDFAASSSNNLLVCNTLMQNTIVADGLSPNNHVGPFDSGSVMTPTNHPWANFVF
ncbi:MAG: NosD domain-containing protein [Kiritimatiellia bacterium]